MKTDKVGWGVCTDERVAVSALLKDSSISRKERGPNFEGQGMESRVNQELEEAAEGMEFMEKWIQ